MGSIYLSREKYKPDICQEVCLLYIHHQFSLLSSQSKLSGILCCLF
uniref:Uncharacterized protein n=1 Tax=Rhizophora mucronata TaxID=61149 RepID=A0A2P2NAH8_RHIMU